MNWIWITFINILLIWLGLHLLARGYRNPKRPHRKTPTDAGISFREVTFPTQNDCRLYGWWIPKTTRESSRAPVIVLVHGWGQNVEFFLPLIKILHSRGFHLLAFDARNHGSSESDGYSNMLKFAEDILAAVDFVRKDFNTWKEWIGVIGFSIGGAAAIYAAAHEPRIRRVVTIGAFAHPAEVMKVELRKRHIPYFPVVWLLFQYIQFKIGARFKHIAPMNNIARASAKILLVHGTEDKIVPVEQALVLQEYGNPERTRLWLVEHAGHFDCLNHPEIPRRLSEFLEKGFSLLSAEDSLTHDANIG